jgi:hypothetical protein
MEEPTLAEKQKGFAFLRAAGRVLAPLDCKGELRRFLPAGIAAVWQKDLYHRLHVVLQFMPLKDIDDHFSHSHQNTFSLSKSSVIGPSLTRATSIYA